MDKLSEPNLSPRLISHRSLCVGSVIGRVNTAVLMSKKEEQLLHRAAGCD